LVAVEEEGRGWRLGGSVGERERERERTRARETKAGGFGAFFVVVARKC
jgi:hypothetical protein